MKESGLKRIVIFSPYLTTQENLEGFLRGYFGRDFLLYNREVEYHKFYDIQESHSKNLKIGLGGEICAIFDHRLIPLGKAGWLEALLEGSKKICDDEKIPYIVYQEEIEKKIEKDLKAKLDRLKVQIYSRLELDDFFKPQ